MAAAFAARLKCNVNRITHAENTEKQKGNKVNESKGYLRFEPVYLQSDSSSSLANELSDKASFLTIGLILLRRPLLFLIPVLAAGLTVTSVGLDDSVGAIESVACDDEVSFLIAFVLPKRLIPVFFGDSTFPGLDTSGLLFVATGLKKDVGLLLTEGERSELLVIDD